MRSSMRLLMVFCVAFQGALSAEETVLLDLRAGERARKDVPVRWEVPAGVSIPSPARLVRAEDGKEVPVQLDAGPPAALVWVLESELAAGAKRRYRVEAGVKGKASPPRVLCTMEASTPGKGDPIQVIVDGKKVLQYNAGQVDPPQGIEPVYARSAYIHPLWSPAGRVVTNDFAVNHKHHHGVWMPWSQSEFEGHPINFWEQDRLEGKVECLKATPISGSVFGGVKAAHRFTDLKNKEGKKPVLDETWDVRVYPHPGYAVIDFTSVQRCAGPSPLLLKGYRYGGFGFRGSADWEGKDGCEFLTSEGKTRKDGHETASFWCEIHGKVGGEWAGVAFLCHPANFRAPQNMRIHDTEPFFNYTPCQDGDFEIRPDRPLVSRYRLVVHDGRLEAGELERLWWDYAKPPEVIRVVEEAH